MMVFNQTRIDYCFPTFKLQIVHDEQNVLGAKFARLENSEDIHIVGVHNALTDEIIRQLDYYCQDSGFQFRLPYQIQGSLHQLKVWQLMREIPAGSVISYNAAAYLIKSAPRAVGGACGKNPFPVFIPCHRIIAANNKLGGFNSGNIFLGTEIKKWLLAHEGIILKV